MYATTSSLRIEPVAACHKVDGFDCGESKINASIKLHTEQSLAGDVTSVFTAVNHHNHIFGFYAISATNIEFKEAPEKITANIDVYPVPAVKIDVLAVDQSMQGKGLGARLLIDALQRIHEAMIEVQVMIVLVDAENERLRAFYLHYGFSPLSTGDTRLFLPMEKVTQLFEKHGK